MTKKIITAVAFVAASLFATSAQAIIVGALSNGADVATNVTPLGNSSWQYAFMVTNDSHVLNRSDVIQQYRDHYTIVDYSLPYFSDANITAILSPAGWTYSIDATDTFGLGHGAQTLHWHASSLANGIAPLLVDYSDMFNFNLVGNSLSGFSFVSGFAPVYGPFAVSFADGSTQFGDPPLPGSPDAILAGLRAPVTNVPEPETYALMLAGLALMGVIGKRRKTQ